MKECSQECFYFNERHIVQLQPMEDELEVGERSMWGQLHGPVGAVLGGVLGDMDVHNIEMPLIVNAFS